MTHPIGHASRMMRAPCAPPELDWEGGAQRNWETRRRRTMSSTKSKKSAVRPDLTEAELNEIREAFNLCVLFRGS